MRFIVLKLFKSFFKKDSSPPSDNLNKLITILNEISNGLGEYSSMEKPSEKIIQKGNEMLSIINDIESKSKDVKNSKLYFSLAVAYRNYCAWYKRGDERKEFLERVVSNLNKALSLNPDHVGAKAELGRILIENKPVRDLETGLKYLQELKDRNLMPFYLESILAKAYRQIGNISLDEDYDLLKISTFPAVFREERKKFRALIKKFKKEKDEKNLKKTLNQFYNLAIYAVLCYHDHDFNTGSLGNSFYKAPKYPEKYANKINFSFEEHGIIKYCRFISRNDWQIFIKVFGDTDKIFDPYSIV